MTVVTNGSFIFSLFCVEVATYTIMIRKHKMRARIWFLLFSLFAPPAYCQVVAIQNDRGNTLYLGIENPLTIVVEKVPLNAITISATNGKIIGGEKGHYSIIPDSLGKVEIEVNKITAKGSVKIYAEYFRVINIPDPIPHFTSQYKSGGYINASVARVQLAPFAGGSDHFGCGKFTIDSVTVIVIRNGKLVCCNSLHNHHGVRFSDDETTQKIMETLMGGDKLLFTGITCYGPDGKTRRLTPMDFTIVDDSGIQVNENTDR